MHLSFGPLAKCQMSGLEEIQIENAALSERAKCNYSTSAI